MTGNTPSRDVKIEHNDTSVVFMTWMVLLTHHSAFSKWPQIQLQSTMAQEVIEISSDDELEDEVTQGNTKSLPLKRRAPSSSAGGSPSKRWITTLDTAIEVLDSDDEPSTTKKAVPMKAVLFSDTRHVKVEHGAEKMASVASSSNATKDKLGRYIITQKVKVDLIENLLEVPTRWPIPLEGTNTAYIIDLNNDKKWQELDTNSKKKQLDCFIKQEVCPTYSHVTYMGNLTEQTLFRLGPRFLGVWD